MNHPPDYIKNLRGDFSAGLVVFLVALPLCLGVALASGAPLISGIVAGAIGGLVVAWISGSHTSISGPAAGLTAIVATQIGQLGSFELFLGAVVIAGAMQIAFGLLKAGSLAAFFPSSVIKGLLAAIGIILILKQIPHLLGHDPDWFGDMKFQQADGHNTITEIFASAFHIHPGAMAIGVISVALLVVWDNTPLKKAPVPAALVVVAAGTGLSLLLGLKGGLWQVGEAHLVQVPVTGSLGEAMDTILHFPDFSGFLTSGVWVAAITVAIVASLETLLNLEAVDKLDTLKRVSPPNRELLAQGVGNMTAGLLGGLPITSVVVRGSVGIRAGSRTRMASVVHGALLIGSVLLLPTFLNMIPLSCLAAILLMTGLKLTPPSLYRRMWQEGYSQFLPFAATVLAIVFTDLLVGVLIGLFIACLFILRNNLKRPLRMINEQHVSGDLLRIELANQVGFLNRASLRKTLWELPRGSRVVLDARNTHYMDPDILDLIQDFEKEAAPAHEIELSLTGFQDHYPLKNRIIYVDYSTREIQQKATPRQVLKVLKDGNERFANGQQILRDSSRQVDVTSAAQYPLAVVLSCMDSRVSTEMIFDLGLGDVFSIRVAGNVAAEKIIGSLEYGCSIAGAKLLVVLGHTRCGAVTAAIDIVSKGISAREATGCENLDAVIDPISRSVFSAEDANEKPAAADEAFVRRVTLRNVQNTMAEVRKQSATLTKMIDQGDLLMIGGIYDVVSGQVAFMDEEQAENQS